MTRARGDESGSLFQRPRRWDGVLLAVWLGALAVVRAGVLQETDPYWQVRAGTENLDGLPLARADSWSWAPVDNLFSQTSPLWNDVLGLGYRWAGFAGFFLVGLLSMVGYFAVAVALARRLGARRLPTLAGVLVAVLPALAMLSPRASLAAQTLFMTGILLADTWRRRARPGPLVDLTAVLVAAFAFGALGSWIHLSWLLLAPATALAWAVLWWTAADMTSGRRVLLSTAGALGAAVGILAGPYGLSAWRLSREVAAACEGVVLEWVGMFTPSVALRWAPAGLLAIAGFAVALGWVWRSWRRRSTDARVGLVAALVVIGLPASLAAIGAIRFIGVALLLLAPLSAMGATALADRITIRSASTPPTGVFRSDRVRRWSEAGPWRVVLTAVAVVLVPAALIAGSLLGRPLNVSSVAEELPEGCRLFSDPGSAGAVLLLRPDVKVWIDGRADYWGHDRNAEAVRVLTGDDVTVPAIQGASCVVLDLTTDLHPTDLAAALDASPEWTRIADGGKATSAWTRTP